MSAFRRLAGRTFLSILSIVLACSIILPVLEGDDAQVLLEVGKDYPETRLFDVCPVKTKRSNIPYMAVAGFSRTDQFDLADLSVFDMQEPDVPALRWRLLRGGSESSSIRTLRAADLDGDGEDELIALGRIGNEEVDSRGELQIFRHHDDQWNSVALQRWQSGQYTHGYGMDIGDVDGDGRLEVVSGGFFLKGEREQAELRVWKLDGTQLTLVASTAWESETGHTRINAVCVGDVTGDGKVAIISAGRTGQMRQDEHVTTHEADQVIVWYLDKAQLVRHSAYENDPTSRSRFRELKLLEIDGEPGLELLAVGRQDLPEVSPRTPGSGGGRGGGKGGGRGKRTGAGVESTAPIRPLMAIFKLENHHLQRISQANFGDALGEVRDVVGVPDMAGNMQIVTITANDLKPNRSARLDVWKSDGSSLRANGQRTIALGVETRARQILVWRATEQQRLFTIGFVQRGEQILGQILDWGPL